MKKAIYVSLLLFANIIMLAHAVVPHHHHNGFIVALLESDHDKNHGHDHDHHHSSNPHNHDSNESSEQCALNEAYTRSDNDLKFGCYKNYDYGSAKYFVSQAGINKFSFVNDYGLPFRQKPFIASYRSIFSSGSIGLRAPPVC